MFERCIYFNTDALRRKLNARWEKAFAQFDLPPSHGYLLRLLLENPGLSQRVIAEKLQLDKSTITQFVCKLEEKGLLKHSASECDHLKMSYFQAEKHERCIPNSKHWVTNFTPQCARR